VIEGMDMDRNNDMVMHMIRIGSVDSLLGSVNEVLGSVNAL
jgi:hypothetical protein